MQFRALRRLKETNAIAGYYRLQMQSESDCCNEEDRGEIVALLEEFGNVFEPPRTLPPSRETDHVIHLEPGKAAVNVKPYRYPHFQKGEIEKQVRQMLENNFIQKSNNPFSSPVLLVKKKDGTRRFCVDYRALNAIMIKEKFPIPTADELFDELGDSRFFSKLDLLAGYHQIRVRQEDVCKTTFCTHEGHYEINQRTFHVPGHYERDIPTFLA
ncbi:hypothetical protein GQ457_09G011640 [Hibiscus cannabinus]